MSRLETTCIRSLTSREWLSVHTKQRRKETHQLCIAVLITQQNARLIILHYTLYHIKCCSINQFSCKHPDTLHGELAYFFTCICFPLRCSTVGLAVPYVFMCIQLGAPVEIGELVSQFLKGNRSLKVSCCAKFMVMIKMVSLVRKAHKETKTCLNTF